MIKSKTLNVRISREDQVYLASLGKSNMSEAIRHLIYLGKKKDLSDVSNQPSLEPLVSGIEDLKGMLAELQMSNQTSQQAAISETIKRFYRTMSPAAHSAIKLDGAANLD